ncbi:hypothetical protein Tco_1437101 [Tanacetum coccineum]
MESQDARLFKFKADFKQQQSEMTNKIDTLLKAITDRITGALPSDMVKNTKLINAIKTYSKEATISQMSLLRPGVEIEPQQPDEPELTLEDEFQDLHLNLPVLEVLAHAPIYNAKDPETPLLVGRGFLATANAVIDCRMAKIAVGEGITRLYLTRRSLEVLRKFHLTILGGRFNQLSHVSSPLLSKPEEY